MKAMFGQLFSTVQVMFDGDLFTGVVKEVFASV